MACAVALAFSMWLFILLWQSIACGIQVLSLSLHVASVLAVARLNVYMWFSDQDGRMWDKLHHVIAHMLYVLSR